MPRLTLRRSVLLACALLTGCTGLNAAVRATLPHSYAVRKPVNTIAHLGTVVDGHNQINACYSGTIDAADKSWNNVSVSYKRASTAKVKADFGSAVAVKGDLEDSVTGNVTLTSSAVFQLKDLFFLPASQCATTARREAYKQSGGATDKVIVRAVRADSVDVSNARSTKAKLEAKELISTKVTGTAAAATDAATNLNLSGKGLFFAEQVVKVHTTLLELRAVELNLGETTNKIGPCRVQILTAGVVAPSTRETWTGSLSCDDGVARPMSGDVNGTISYRQTGEGVSYSVEVLATKLPGKYSVSYSRWVVSG